MNRVKGLDFFYAVKQCEDLKVKYYEEMTQRKKLFNEVQEAKGMLLLSCLLILFSISRFCFYLTRIIISQRR